MKTEIKKKIQQIIDSYNTAKRDIVEKIEQWKNDTIYSDEYKNEKIKELEADAASYDALFNNKVKEVIAEEKKAIIGEPESKPADYQVQISNALKFLELAGDKLTDDQAYNILKPFQKDYETMMLFQPVVGALTQNHGVWSKHNKIFEKTNSFMTLINSFELAEKTMDNLFNFKENKSLAGNVRHNMFMDSINHIEKLVNAFED
jgi:hypothetical protein